MTDYVAADTLQDGAIARRARGNNALAFRDGLSNTVLLGEKQLNVAQAAVGRNYDDDFGPFCGYDHDGIRSTAVPPAPDFRGQVSGAGWPPGYSPDFGANRFGSSHHGGFPVATAVGRVRFFKYSINPVLWAGMGTIAGDEVVTWE
jgi:hypothetical protein